ncbi:MAG: hypothetical protein ACRCX2_17545 [Paraclostridium sp.]
MKKKEKSMLLNDIKTHLKYLRTLKNLLSNSMHLILIILDSERKICTYNTENEDFKYKKYSNSFNILCGIRTSLSLMKNQILLCSYYDYLVNKTDSKRLIL